MNRRTVTTAILSVCAMALCAGCTTGHKDKAAKHMDKTLREYVRQADADNLAPSDIVDVKVFYIDNDEVASNTCRGFVTKTDKVFNNVGIILGTYDSLLTDRPFVFAFPTATGTPSFTAVATPNNTRYERHRAGDGGCYVIKTATIKDAIPKIDASGKYGNDINGYIFVLSTLNVSDNEVPQIQE